MHAHNTQSLRLWQGRGKVGSIFHTPKNNGSKHEHKTPLPHEGPWMQQWGPQKTKQPFHDAHLSSRSLMPCILAVSTVSGVVSPFEVCPFFFCSFFLWLPVGPTDTSWRVPNLPLHMEGPTALGNFQPLHLGQGCCCPCHNASTTPTFPVYIATTVS